VGLSVETASHDIMGIMGKVLTNLDGLISDLMSDDELDRDELLKELQSVRGGMSFIEAQLKDIQLLFRSSKQRRKSIRVKDIVDKVERIYRRLLKKESIRFTISSFGSPLVAKTTDAVLLQLLLNLFDNAVYWLQQTSKTDKKIEILLDGNKGQIIFSDNGSGIIKEDIPYIFEPFYSGKGDEGRGLGLYIARQLLERNDYSIELAELKSEQILSGANFIINLLAEEK
jgi:C4-dicarboxylate-specific signal transduction histidine kinase